MLRLLKKYFIPHKHNNHRPHLLRTEVMIFVLGVVVAAEALFLYSTLVVYPGSNFFSLILPSVLAESANTSRVAQHRPQLTVNPLLVQAAQMKADDMAAKGYFAHMSPAGVTPWYWIQQAGYRYRTAGENLAVNFIDSQDVHNAWMNSTSHRDNILNPVYSEIGIATATGMYKGDEVVFVVQMFGQPVRPVAAALSPMPTPAPLRTRTTAPVAVTTATNTPLLSAGRSQVSIGLPVANASATGRALSKPRVLTSRFFLIVLGIIGLAMALCLIVWMKVRHPRLIVNGMAVAAVILTLLILNQHLATRFADIL